MFYRLFNMEAEEGVVLDTIHALGIVHHGKLWSGRCFRRWIGHCSSWRVGRIRGRCKHQEKTSCTTQRQLPYTMEPMRDWFRHNWLLCEKSALRGQLDG